MPPSRLIYLALVAPAPYSYDRQCMRPRGHLPPIATVPAPPSGPAHAESHSTAICIAYHCNLRQPGPDGMSPPAVCLALTAVHRVVGVTVGKPRATGTHGSPAGQRLWLRLLHILDDLLDGVASVVCGDRQLAELGGQFNLRSRRAMSRLTLEEKGLDGDRVLSVDRYIRRTSRLPILLTCFPASSAATSWASSLVHFSVRLLCFLVSSTSVKVLPAIHHDVSISCGSLFCLGRPRPAE